MAAWLNELVRGSLVNVVIQHSGMAHLLLHCHLALIAAAQDAVRWRPAAHGAVGSSWEAVPPFLQLGYAG